MIAQRRIIEYLSEPYHLKHGVTMAMLIDAVYSEEPNGGPDNAEGVLRVILWRLRGKGHNIGHVDGSRPVRYILIPRTTEERVRLELQRQGVEQDVDIARLIAAIA